MTKTFRVTYKDQPWKNTSFQIRGVCQWDVLNPCWDNRPKDVAGQHWSGMGQGCDACTKEANKAKGL